MRQSQLSYNTKNLPINPNTNKKVHLNSAKIIPMSPYLRGKVCHIMISIMMKIITVMRIWMG
jgi:hypothetical protein